MFYLVSRDTLYRYIRLGLLKSVKSGRRLTYVSKSELLKLFPLRKEALEDTKPLVKLYRMEPEDCYTIGEVAKKNGWMTVRCIYTFVNTLFQLVRLEITYMYPKNQLMNYIKTL